MKISKAKERALMKEFGLDETVLSEEDLAKRRSRLKTLITLGKTRGYLTHGEISDHLPDKLVDAETMEVVVTMLNDMGVAVYEQTPDAETLLLNNTAPTATTVEEAEEEAEAALSTVDSEFGRTTDPVRMYMREMGTVELLTREGEIEIAKRIEGGLMAMMEAISASPPPSPRSCAWPPTSVKARSSSPPWWTASRTPTKPTTTWPRKTSTSSTRKTTTTARAAPRPSPRSSRNSSAMRSSASTALPRCSRRSTRSTTRKATARPRTRRPSRPCRTSS